MQVISNPANGMWLKNVILSRFNRREKTKTNSWFNDLIGASKLKKRRLWKKGSQRWERWKVFCPILAMNSTLFFSLVLLIFSRESRPRCARSDGSTGCDGIYSIPAIVEIEVVKKKPMAAKSWKKQGPENVLL